MRSFHLNYTENCCPEIRNYNNKGIISSNNNNDKNLVLTVNIPIYFITRQQSINWEKSPKVRNWERNLSRRLQQEKSRYHEAANLILAQPKNKCFLFTPVAELSLLTCWFGLNFPIGNNVIKVTVLLNVVFIFPKRLIQGPT